MDPDFAYSVTSVGDVHLVSLGGELDMATARGLLDWLIHISGSKIVVDLSALTFMDSSGLSVMVQARNELGNSLVLTRPQPNVRRVFEISGLAGWLTDWDSSWMSASPA